MLNQFPYTIARRRSDTAHWQRQMVFADSADTALQDARAMFPDDNCELFRPRIHAEYPDQCVEVALAQVRYILSAAAELLASYDADVDGFVAGIERMPAELRKELSETTPH
jgi:hypothetical protein